MASKLKDALPCRGQPVPDRSLGAMRPRLSPTLVELNRGAFVRDDGLHSTVNIAGHRVTSDLAELDLCDSEIGG